MEAKDKAKELIECFENAHSSKMSDYSKIYTPSAKVCALICVDEILEECLQLKVNFWEEVKQELNKL